MELSVSSFERFCDRCLKSLQQPIYACSAVCIFLLWFFLSNLTADPDLFARVAAGRLIEKLAGVPSRDPFAYTPKHELWIDHEWLAGVVFYFLSQFGGDFLLFAFKVFMAFFSVFFLMRAGQVYSQDKKVPFFWLLITAFTCGYIWTSTIRSQVFTYLFLPVSLLAFAAHQKNSAKKMLFLLPLMMFVWCNAHGGFVVGLGLHFIYLLLCLIRDRRRVWPVLLSFLLSFAATCINPYGALVYWQYILNAVSMERPDITEWQTLAVWSGAAVIPNILVVLLAVGIYRSRRNLDWTALVFLLVALYFGYRHLRLLAVFMMVAYVCGGKYLASCMETLPRFCQGLLLRLRRAAAVMALFFLPLLLILRLSVFIQIPFGLDYGSYPFRSCEFLWHSAPGGRVLVDFNNGSFALWRLFPNFQISLDGRYEEVYLNETLGLVSSAMDPASPDHQKALQAVMPDFIITPLHKGGGADFGPQWPELFRSDQFAVLGHDRLKPFERGKMDSFETWERLSVWQPRY